MSGATGELTRGGLNREQDETIQQLCQPDPAALPGARNDAMKRFSSSAGGGNAVPRSSWQREDNEKSLSQL